MEYQVFSSIGRGWIKTTKENYDEAEIDEKRIKGKCKKCNKMMTSLDEKGICDLCGGR